MKKKVRFVAVGKCPVCQKEYVRPYPADTAFCQCESLTAVPLELALVLPESLYKRYEQIAGLAQVSIEDLVNAVLEVGLKEKLKEIVEVPNYNVSGPETVQKQSRNIGIFFLH